MRYGAGSKGGTYDPEVSDIERAGVVGVRICGDEDGDRAGGGEAGGRSGDGEDDGGELHFGGCCCGLVWFGWLKVIGRMGRFGSGKSVVVESVCML